MLTLGSCSMWSCSISLVTSNLTQLYSEHFRAPGKHWMRFWRVGWLRPKNAAPFGTEGTLPAPLGWSTFKNIYCKYCEMFNHPNCRITFTANKYGLFNVKYLLFNIKYYLFISSFEMV